MCDIIEVTDLDAPELDVYEMCIRDSSRRRAAGWRPGRGRSV